MNRINLLIAVCLVIVFCINSSYAFCGGCICNIWNCNCDLQKQCRCDYGRSSAKYGDETSSAIDETQRFKSIDINKDQAIDKNETIIFMSKFNKDVDSDQVLKWFNQTDKNGDGLIQFNEFESDLQK